MTASSPARVEGEAEDEAGVRAQLPLRTGSLRRRVVVTVVALLAVLLVVLSLTVDTVLRNRTEGQLEQRLLDRVAVAEALADQVSEQDLVDRVAGEGVSVRLTTTDGTVLSAGPAIVGDDGTADGSSSDSADGTTGDSADATSDGTSGDTPAAPGNPSGPGGPGPDRRPTPPGQTPEGEVIQVGDIFSIERTLSVGTLSLATDAGGLRQTLSQVRVVLVASSAVVLTLAALALLGLVGRVLSPLDRITATARSITAGDRGQRLRPDQPSSELGRTATAFDDMLDELEGAEGRARAAESRVRDFMLEAAHELRTPLAGVQAAAETLLVSDPPREERERLTVGVVREARRASRLADDMLTMARIDHGLELQTRSSDVSALVRAVAETTRNRTQRSTVAVTGHGSLWADVDPDRVTQILTNVVDNAVRAAGSGGHIAVEVEATGPGALDGVRITVRDNGPGVPDADRDRIFERLVRLDDARTRDQGGAGLGLAIARGLARAHGGELRLVPQARGIPGAVFELTLPGRQPS